MSSTYAHRHWLVALITTNLMSWCLLFCATTVHAQAARPGSPDVLGTQSSSLTHRAAPDAASALASMMPCHANIDRQQALDNADTHPDAAANPGLSDYQTRVAKQTGTDHPAVSDGCPQCDNPDSPLQTPQFEWLATALTVAFWYAWLTAPEAPNNPLVTVQTPYPPPVRLHLLNAVFLI